jgi:hypothetical protein
MKIDMHKFYSPAFILCIAVLAAAAGMQQYTLNKLGVILQKEPIPLKNELDELDESKLGVYKVVNKQKIENLEILEALGTEQYIQWIIEDTTLPKDSPFKYCSLFVTYYTGNPDRVPHVPDACYTGAGNTMLEADNIYLPLQCAKNFESYEQSIDLKENLKVPLRRTIFEQNNPGEWISSQKFAVFYFFKANGQYGASRTTVRKIMGQNLFSKYAYFSKVEWKFFGLGGPNRIFYPDPDEQIEQSAKLMNIVLPILENDHWPDWAEATEKSDD